MEAYLRLAAALAPAIILAMTIIRKDRRPEPARWLLASAGLGVLCGFAVIALGGTVLPDFGTATYADAILTSFVTAAMPEELCKFAALCFVASRCRHFDEHFDGIVYAVCIGMGFAGIENILYLFSDDNWLAIGLARGLLSVPAHYFFAVIMGYFFALGRFNPSRRNVCMAAALLVPVLVHGLYDTLCFSMGIDEDFGGVILLLFLVGFRWIRRCVRRLVSAHLQADCSLEPPSTL